MPKIFCTFFVLFLIIGIDLYCILVYTYIRKGKVRYKKMEINGIEITLCDNMEWSTYDQQWIKTGVTEDGKVYNLYYESLDDDMELDEYDFENPVNMEKLYEVSLPERYKRTGNFKEVRHGLVDFVAQGLAKYEGEYIQPVEIGYTVFGDELEPTHIFIDGKSFEDSNGNDICTVEETINL